VDQCQGFSLRRFRLITLQSALAEANAQMSFEPSVGCGLIFLVGDYRMPERETAREYRHEFSDKHPPRKIFEGQISRDTPWRNPAHPVHLSTKPMQNPANKLARRVLRRLSLSPMMHQKID
jgi:hypothetical protein